MPSLNFKQQFVPLIESGQKRQTIRKTRKRPFNAGDTLYLFTGMRTAKCTRLKTHRCVSVQPIRITQKTVELDGQELTSDEVERLAHADGFRDATQFLAFFNNEQSLPLEGQLIRW